MAGLSSNVRCRLSVMMFLQYAYNGIWFIPMGTYLNEVGYSGLDIGAAYGTFAVGCLIAPFIAGMIADRFFAAQKLLGVFNIISSVLLVLAAKEIVGPDGKAHIINGQVSLGAFYWLLIAHFVFYMPTWALTNTISLRQMSNPAKQFPSIRVMGTIGWIAVSMVALFGKQVNEMLNTTEPFEKTATPMYIGAAIGILTGLTSFFMPDTPPGGKDKTASVADILGLKALGLFKDRDFVVFAVTSLAIMFAGLFYWNFANVYLNESNVKAAQSLQSIGQMVEMVFLFVMPWFFARFGVKKMLLLGLFAWIARFICFSYGQWEGGTAALVVLGLMLHGPCYDFFFVTGQLYTDKKASKDIQAQAQGLISLITFGLGWFFGSMLAGFFVDKYAIKDAAGKVTGHDWHTIWLCPIAIAAVLIVFFLLFFKDNTAVGHEEPAAARLDEAPNAEVPVGH